MNKQTNRDANERNHKTDADKIKAKKKCFRQTQNFLMNEAKRSKKKFSKLKLRQTLSKHREAYSLQKNNNTGFLFLLKNR